MQESSMRNENVSTTDHSWLTTLTVVKKLKQECQSISQCVKQLQKPRCLGLSTARCIPSEGLVTDVCGGEESRSKQVENAVSDEE